MELEGIVVEGQRTVLEGYLNTSLYEVHGLDDALESHPRVLGVGAYMVMGVHCRSMKA